MGFEFNSEDEIKGQFDILKKRQDSNKKGIEILKKYIEIDKALRLLRNSKHHYVKIKVTGIDDESEDMTDTITFEANEEAIKQNIDDTLVQEKYKLYRDYKKIR